MEMREKIAEILRAKVLEKQAAPNPNIEPLRGFGLSAMEGLGKFVGNDLPKGIADTVLNPIQSLVKEHVLSKFGPKSNVSTMASLIGPGGAARKALGMGLLAAGLGAGVSLADSGFGKAKKEIEVARGLKRTIADNPWLLNEDPKDVKKHYRALYEFEPTVAKNPLTAASWLKRTLMFKNEGVQAADLKTLAEIGKNLREKRKETVLESAFKSTPNTVTEVFKSGLTG